MSTEEVLRPTLSRQQYLQLAVWLIALSTNSEPGVYDDLVRLVDVFKGTPLLNHRSPLDAMVLQLHLQKQSNPMAAEMLNSSAPPPLESAAITALLASLVDAMASTSVLEDLRDALYSFAVDDEFWDDLEADLKETEKAVDVAAAAINRSGGIQ